MRDMLEPVFGESGAVVAQFLITLVIILLVIGLAYWLVRRFAGVSLHGVGRGRMPRLAVIDALPVDSRRKLVLVRRDNVEHLLLIGGTSDLVVEPSIQRTSTAQRPRQPQPQPQPAPQQPAQPAARPAPPQQQATQAAGFAPMQQPRPESTGISEPIPFPPQAAARPAARRAGGAGPAHAPGAEPAPQRRAATRPVPVQTEPLAAVASPVVRSLAASAHFEEPTRPTRVESVLALAETVETPDEQTVAPPPEATPDQPPEPVPVATSTPEPKPAEPQASLEETPAESPEISPEPAPATAMEENAGPEEEPQTDERDRAAKVSDLEKEMARLLGEITARRES